MTSTEIEGRASAGGPTTIAGYNTHATHAATAVADLNALGTTWSAFVTVEYPYPNGGSFITAQTNTGTSGVGGVPIYNLAGELVANDYPDLYDGSIANAIDVTELGTPAPDQPGGNKLVWTGARNDGSASGDWSLITPSGGWMYYGHADTTDGTWLQDLGGESGWDGNAQTDSQMPIYAISGVLEAPQPSGDDIPEPATMALLGLAACGLGGYVRRRRRT